MSDDRKLLEAAAKAAGIELASSPHEHGYSGVLMREWVGDRIYWSPLTDDGDAFRLVVKLGLDIRPNGDQYVEVDITNEDEPFGHLLAKEPGPDMLAATRRAIVRAAAAMGGKT